jgi:cytolysin-activating lysine-acyltransferase
MIIDAKTQPETPKIAAVPPTVSHMVGEIVWLMTQSPLHRHFAIADLEWMVMPAILLNQYRVFHEQGRPVGVALWGFLSQEAETRLSLPLPRLRSDEWRSGNRCWLVDLIAPFANEQTQIVATMLGDLQNTALRGKIFKVMLTNVITGARNIVTFGNQNDSI